MARVYAGITPAGERQPDPIPDVISLNHPDLSPRVLAILEAVEWRWTITEILAQPEAILADVLELRGLGLTIAKAEKASK